MIKRYIIFSLLLSLLVGACSEDAVGPTLVMDDVVAPVLSAPADGSSYTLTEETVDAVFAEFSWSAADYGFDAGVDYEVEMDLGGNSFADAVSLGVANGKTTLSVTNGKVNSVMLGKGLPGALEAAMEFRVKAEVADDVAPVYSNVITLNITPFEAVIDYPKLYVPGSYQGWDPSNEETVIWSVKSDGKYEGYIYFPDDNVEFKFTEVPNWNDLPALGKGSEDGTLIDDPGAGNLVAGAAGYYKLNVNRPALTYSAVRTEWGLIGDATGSWDVDQNMTYDEATGIWSITTDLTGGAFIKFRANDGWDINLGDNDTDLKLEYSGSDIPIAESGNYTVELHLNVPVYTYRIIKN